MHLPEHTQRQRLRHPQDLENPPPCTHLLTVVTIQPRRKIVSFQLRDLLRLSWKWGLLAPLYICVEHGPKAGVSPIDLQLKEIIKAGVFVRARKVTGTEQAKKTNEFISKVQPLPEQQLCAARPSELQGMSKTQTLLLVCHCLESLHLNMISPATCRK